MCLWVGAEGEKRGWGEVGKRGRGEEIVGSSFWGCVERAVLLILLLLGKCGERGRAGIGELELLSPKALSHLFTPNPNPNPNSASISPCAILSSFLPKSFPKPSFPPSLPNRSST